MKAAIRRQLQADRATARLEFVGPAGSKLAIKENVAGGVGSKHSRSIYARQTNIAGSPDVCPDQVALYVARIDLAAASFEIDRRARRQLNLEIHIADIAAPAIIANDIDHQTGFCLARIERRFAI